MLHISKNITLPSIDDLLLYGRHYSNGSSPLGIENEEDGINSHIKLPPLQDTNSPSPYLIPLYPKEQQRYYHDIETTSNFTVTTLSPVSSTSSSSASELISDDNNNSPVFAQQQQRVTTISSPYPIISNKCKHFHGRSFSSDETSSIIPYFEKPPWISKPLGIITAVTDPPNVSTPTINKTIALSCRSASYKATTTSLSSQHTTALKKHTSQQSSNGRKYVCMYCSKAFTRPSSLRTHVYSHTGQKPFACTFRDCDKRFSVLSNMRRHMRRHSAPNFSTITTPATMIASPSSSASSD